MNFKQYRQEMTKYKNDNPIDLDKRLGFTNGTIQRLENGAQKANIDQLEAIEKVMLIDFDWLRHNAFKQPVSRKKKNQGDDELEALTAPDTAPNFATV